MMSPTHSQVEPVQSVVIVALTEARAILINRRRPMIGIAIIVMFLQIMNPTHGIQATLVQNVARAVHTVTNIRKLVEIIHLTISTVIMVVDTQQLRLTVIQVELVKQQVVDIIVLIVGHISTIRKLQLRLNTIEMELVDILVVHKMMVGRVTQAQIVVRNVLMCSVHTQARLHNTQIIVQVHVKKL